LTGVPGEAVSGVFFFAGTAGPSTITRCACGPLVATGVPETEVPEAEVEGALAAELEARRGTLGVVCGKPEVVPAAEPDAVPVVELRVELGVEPGTVRCVGADAEAAGCATRVVGMPVPPVSADAAGLRIAGVLVPVPSTESAGLRIAGVAVPAASTDDAGLRVTTVAVPSADTAGVGWRVAAVTAPLASTVVEGL
jgi:hypothetical protein